MKLFWKLFTRTICLVLFIFSLFGSVLLYSSFRLQIEEEKTRMSNETVMFQYAMVSTLGSLPGDYEAVDYAISKIGDSIVKSMVGEQENIFIYKEDGTVVYSSGNESAEPDAGFVEQYENPFCGIVKSNDSWYLQSFSEMKLDNGSYYLEIYRDISRIYENRESIYRRYKLILLIGFVVAALFTFVLTAGFLRPIRRLSAATGRFAAGDLDARVDVAGNDEISMLMEDFNEMADKLEDTMQQLKHNVRQQEEFTASFAHELKTPLTSIVGYADMVRSMEMSREDQYICGDYIFKQGTRLENLSYKMLELVGMDKHRIELKAVDVKRLLKNAVNMSEALLKEKEIVCSVNMQEAVVLGDYDLLLSLVSNIIDNGRKACEQGGHICIEGSAADGVYEISIEDDGRGIPSEELENIKEAFYMVDKSRARKDGGAGIGMALCEKIIRLHNAQWIIDSRPGEGTRVKMSFALCNSDKKDGDGENEPEEGDA